MMRPKTSPVMRSPPGPLATGRRNHCAPAAEAVARTAVLPALSPCQALASRLSPAAISAAAIGKTRPRLGTSCQSRPLAWAASTGVISTKVAT